jgi:hypothetical protein
LLQKKLHVIRGNREAEPDRAACRRIRENLVVDADDLAARIEQRATGIAVIDRRVGLNEFVIRTAEIAVESADDAVCDRALQTERVADRENAVTDMDLVAVADLDRRQRPADVDLQKCQIEVQSLAEQAGICRGAVLQRHHDLVGVLDHVPVGDDDPARIDDRAGADDVDDVRRVGDVLRRLARIGALTFTLD